MGGLVICQAELVAPQIYRPRVAEDSMLAGSRFLQSCRIVAPAGRQLRSQRSAQAMVRLMHDTGVQLERELYLGCQDIYRTKVASIGCCH